MGKKEHLFTLVAICIGITNMKSSLAVPQKIKYRAALLAWLRG